MNNILRLEKQIIKKETELNVLKRQLLSAQSPNSLIVECGNCKYYNNRGFCEHSNSIDSCADRDSDCKCSINKFKERENR